MKLKLCIVVGKYYQDAANDLIRGATLILNKYNKSLPKKKEIEYRVVFTPGVFEIPYIISCNIKKKYKAFIALGCVIKGETPHFDFISKATINGIMNLSIKHRIPITNGIVTCLNKKQALERCSPQKKDKGGEAAKALLHLLSNSKDKHETR